MVVACVLFVVEKANYRRVKEKGGGHFYLQLQQRKGLARKIVIGFDHDELLKRSALRSSLRKHYKNRIGIRKHGLPARQVDNAIVFPTRWTKSNKRLT